MKIRRVAHLWQGWVSSKCLFQIFWIIEISAVEEHVMINTSHHWHICAHLREIGLVMGVIWAGKGKFFQRQISLGIFFFFGSEYAETQHIKSFFRKSEKKSNISTHFHETASKGPVHTVYTTQIIGRRFFVSHPIFNFSAVLESSDPHDSENGSRVALRATEKDLSL